MPTDAEQLYAQRLNRYVTAMRNEKPDRVPIRPFVAEFTAKYAGFTCQDVTHDYTKAFEAAVRCAADFDWDAVVANMVYVWTGLTQAIGLRYYAAPGIDIPPDVGFQYVEPPEEQAFMAPDEYDRLIDDPVRYLFEVWLPRVSPDVQELGRCASYRNNLSFLKGGMAMLSYFYAFGPQVQRLRTECGTVSAIAGILKAPMDILADKLRGYLGLCADLVERPDKVQAACEALAPHLLHVALAGADPQRYVPVGFWMHRGCVPFVSRKHFDEIYWPTLRPIVEGLWAAGHQTLFYAEGDWNAHLGAFCELPDRSIVYHVDQADIGQAHRALGHKFCISGGMPNFLLSYGTERQVRDRCKWLIDAVGADGGYILDAAAIVQDDARIENVRAMTDVARDYGAYGSAPASAQTPPTPRDGAPAITPTAMKQPNVRPGVCIPWADKRAELPEVITAPDLCRRVWEDVDALAYTYIWQCLLSF